MYEVQHVESQFTYNLLSPSGTIVQPYKYNPTIMTSQANAWHQCQQHANKMNRLWNNKPVLDELIERMSSSACGG